MERFTKNNIDKIITGNGIVPFVEIKEDIISGLSKSISIDSFVDKYDITSVLKSKSIEELNKIREVDYGIEKDVSASERFGLIKHLEVIGNGSDRKVFKLDNGMVLKLAKNTRGLTQNDVENNMTNDQNFYFDTKIVPEVFEIGKDYIIVEEVKNYRKGDKETDKKINLFLKDFKNFTITEYDKSKGLIWEILDKKGISNVLDYDLMWGDFTSPRNWGVDNEDNVIHLDGGSFDNSILRLHSQSNEGRKTISQPSSRWESTSKRLLKEFIEDMRLSVESKNVGIGLER